MKNLLLFLLACCLCAAASARPIRGSVKCGGKPMGGVTVTDGYTFAQSDEQGIFTLDADDQALFISLVTPSGYLAPLEGGIPQFYRTYDPAAKRYDFELQPWPGSGECYELLAIADPQPKTEEHFRRLRSEVMPALQAATDNGRTRGSNQAAIVLGDIVWDSPELFAGVKAEFAKLEVPVYGVIGNHDHDLNKYTDREATENYRSHFGPTYYAFDMGRTHYIVLDDIVYHGAKKYEERIDTMQLRWAAAYAERLPAGSRVCIAMHAPAMKSWLGNRVMESAERLMDAFAAATSGGIRSTGTVRPRASSCSANAAGNSRGNTGAWASPRHGRSAYGTPARWPSTRPASWQRCGTGIRTGRSYGMRTAVTAAPCSVRRSTTQIIPHTSTR